jgi:predicted CoA-binding protein
MALKTDEEIEAILRASRTIAVVGCSRDPEKDAHRVPRYLQEQGYRIIPINPQAEEILGERAYPSLGEVKARVDIVQVFRPSEQAYAVVQEAIKLRPKAIWMQRGIVNEEAARLAEERGIAVVMDRCMMAEHKRLLEREQR